MPLLNRTDSGPPRCGERVSLSDSRPRHFADGCGCKLTLSLHCHPYYKWWKGSILRSRTWKSCDRRLFFFLAFEVLRRSQLPYHRRLRLWAAADLRNGSRFVDRKSTRLNSSHLGISYAVFCLK